MTPTLNYYEYRQERRDLKKRLKPKNKKALTPEQVIDRVEYNNVKEIVWKFLLGSEERESSSHQDYHYYTYQPKPHPDDVEANEAQILILESQRRFFQMFNPAVRDGQELYHLDLSSAYLTALANVKHSLKFHSKYPLPDVWNLRRDRENNPIHEYINDDLFNIIKVRLEMPYDNKINMFAPNTKIIYKGKQVGDHNLPLYGERVQVSLELFVSDYYNIDSWDSFGVIFDGYDIDFKRVDVFTYELVRRNDMFDMMSVKILLDSLKEESKATQRHYKNAIVTFTGQLMNIDPGRRLIMLALNEEVMRRLYLVLSRHTMVYGIQIDGIYFEPFDWPDFAHPLDMIKTIGEDVYGKFPQGYTKHDFAKMELWSSDKYKATQFRLQEVRNR